MFPFKIKEVLTKKTKEEENLIKIKKDLSCPYGCTDVYEDENMILSSKISLGFDTMNTKRNCNSILFGGAGSGKTRLFTVPNLLQANCNYVIVNEIDDVYNRTKDFFISQGYKVKCLNLSNIEESTCYNPFQYIDTDKDIIKISKLISLEMDENEDPFFKKAKESLLCAGIDYMMKNHPHSKCTIKLLLEFFNKMEYDIDCLLNTLPTKSIGYEKYQTYNLCSSSQKSEIIYSLRKLLAKIISNTSSILEKDEMNFEDFKKRKAILYIILPYNDDKGKFLTTLLIEQLHSYLINNQKVLNEEEEIFANMHKRNKPKYTLCTQPKLKYHLKFMIEQLEILPKIELEMLLSISRPYNISFSITTNTISVLRHIGYDIGAVMGNCDSIIFFGSTDIETCNYFNTLSTINNVNGTTKCFMTTDEFLRLECNKCVILIRGYEPIIDDKYELTKHKNYKYYD